MNLKELRHQHAEIMTVAHELAAAVEDSSQQQPVSALRWRLARKLLAHLAVEDDHFYPAMLSHENPSTRQTAARFQSEMGTLSTAFTRYMSAWTDVQIADQWPEFCQDTLSLLCKLERRVKQEEQRLYPIAPDSWATSPSA